MIWILACLIFSTFINHGVGIRFHPCGLRGSNTRVYGGTEAAPNSWPWLVSIQTWLGVYTGEEFPAGIWAHNCGGSILTEKIVISAAHCFDVPSFKAANNRIVPGLHVAKLPPITESFSEWGTPVYEIDKIYLPSDWNTETMYHDLAIMTMKTSFLFNEKIKPIKLDFRQEYTNALKEPKWNGETCCKLAGWGQIDNGSNAVELQEVGVPIFDLNTCANNHVITCLEEKAKDNRTNCGIVTSDTFCAGKGGKDSCFGDSGGPILCNYRGKENYLTGVVSFGPNNLCGSSTDPGVYTKISSFESTIKQVLMDSPKFNTNIMKEYPGLKSMKL